MKAGSSVFGLILMTSAILTACGTRWFFPATSRQYPMNAGAAVAAAHGKRPLSAATRRMAHRRQGRKQKQASSTVQEILDKSREYRHSEGTDLVDVLWHAENERDLMTWAKSIPCSCTHHFRTNMGTGVITLESSVGSGVGHTELLVYKGTDKAGWDLAVVYPTGQEERPMVIAGRSDTLRMALDSKPDRLIVKSRSGKQLAAIAL